MRYDFYVASAPDYEAAFCSPRPAPLMSWPMPRMVPQLEANMEMRAEAMRRMMRRLCFWIMMEWGCDGSTHV